MKSSSRLVRFAADEGFFISLPVRNRSGTTAGASNSTGLLVAVCSLLKALPLSCALAAGKEPFINLIGVWKGPSMRRSLLPSLLLRVLWILGVLLGAGSAWGSEGPVRVSGLMYGDLYVVARHSDASLEGANGAWFRRIYLTFDKRASEKVDLRVRFEANSAGDFETSSSPEPFVKDAYVKYTEGRQSIYFGIASTPTWNRFEEAWGYRSVERTPLDLQRMASSRDFGLAAKGALSRDGRVFYHAMIGNGNSVRSETNSGKKAMLAIGVSPTDRVFFEAYGDFENRPGETNRITYQATAAYESERTRIGILAARQDREVPGATADVELAVASVFVVQTLSDRMRVLARYDHAFDANPDAGRVAYLSLDPTARIRFLLVGVDVQVVDGVSVIPNVEAVFYSAEDGDEAPGAMVMPRLTVSATF